MNKHLSRLLLALSLALAAAPLGKAADIYINNIGGSDRADGKTPTQTAEHSGPLRTIARGLQIAGGGDRIILANNAQPYHESISLQGPRNSGLGGERFAIVGNGATLDGTLAVPDGAWGVVGHDVFRFRPRGLAYQMLYSDGRPLRQRMISKITPSMPKLAPLEWCLYDGYLYFRTEKKKIPQDYKLANTVLDTGITLYGVRDVLISDVIVQGYRYDGIGVADRSTDVRLAGVTLRGNGRSGLSVCGASLIAVDHSLIGDNGTAQARVEFPALLALNNSEVLANTAPRFDWPRGARLLVDGQPPKRE